MSDTFKTILVADDDALTRSAYKSALERSGYRVFTAQDGEEALQLYRDVRALRIYEGTTEIQQLVIAGQVLGAHAPTGGV